MNRACLFICSIGLASVFACDRSEKPSSTSTSSANEPRTGSTMVGSARATDVTPLSTVAPATEHAEHKPAVTWKNVGLSTPESVLHDDVADVYLVSNVDGKPAEADGKGFISRLTPDGGVENLKWIDSGKNKVTLNAPKGMAIAGDLLYVADLDTVRIFDRKTGAPMGDVKIPGATFLNDVGVASDGRIIVSDTGLKSGANGLESSGSDAVYAIEAGPKDAKQRKVTPLMKSKDLGGPNGVLARGDKTWVVGFGNGELYSLDAKGKKGDVQKLPKGSLDGIVMIGDDVVVSSWEGNAIYRGKPGGELKVLIEDVKSPADMGYDKKRGRLLVPLFTDSEIRAYDLK